MGSRWAGPSGSSPPSVAPGGASLAAGVTYTEGPKSIIVAFSGPVDRNSVTPNDLVITGNGLNNLVPAKAQSLTWIDEQTVRFNLTGGYKFDGTVNLSIPSGAVKSRTGASSLAYSDSFKVHTPQIQAATVAPRTRAPTTTSPSTTTNVAPHAHADRGDAASGQGTHQAPESARSHPRPTPESRF